MYTYTHFMKVDVELCGGQRNLIALVRGEQRRATHMKHLFNIKYTHVQNLKRIKYFKKSFSKLKLILI